VTDRFEIFVRQPQQVVTHAPLF